MLPGYNRNREFKDPDTNESKSNSIFKQYNLKWICISCNITSFFIGIQVIYFILYNNYPPQSQIDFWIFGFYNNFTDTTMGI